MAESEQGAVASEEQVRADAEIELEVEDSPPLDSLVYPPDGGELFFSFVAPLGSDLKPIISRLEELLEARNCNCVPVVMSELIQETTCRRDVAGLDEFDRISALQKAGDELREYTRNDVLAAMAVGKIYKERREEEQRIGRFKEGEGYRPHPVRQAYIIKSLKHPAEATFLRTIYGHGFYLIGVHAPWEDRKSRLVDEFGMSEDQAKDLIGRDEKESEDFGQNTRDTFELADYFLRSDGDTKREVERFVDLVFGDLFITPRKEEYGMHLAAVNAFRSADLSRQVGACILDHGGNVLGCGTNEVPKAFGGSYWDGDTKDHRDFKHGRDPNDARKADRFAKLSEVLSRHGYEIAPNHLDDALRSSGLRDITEFGRSVHAEMDAIMSCTRRGVPTKWATLFCTTFPCHNCARHIVAAGIRRVVYIEPYPKSEAHSLHYDSIVCPAIPRPPKAPIGCSRAVTFEPFVGVAPRRMSDFFNLRHLTGRLQERKQKGRPVERTKPAHQRPRLQLSPFSYLERENLAIEFVSQYVPIFEEEE